MQTDEAACTNLILIPQGQGINPFARDIDLMGMAGQLISPDGLGWRVAGNVSCRRTADFQLLQTERRDRQLPVGLCDGWPVAQRGLLGGGDDVHVEWNARFLASALAQDRCGYFLTSCDYATSTGRTAAFSPGRVCREWPKLGRKAADRLSLNKWQLSVTARP